MKRSVWLLPLIGGILMASRQLPLRQQPSFTVPEGFAVQEVYSPEKAGTVVAFTFDSQGRLVVARENGPVVTLVDTNGDGTIDREVEMTDSSTVIASQGLVFDGPDLLVVGRGAEGTGLYRVVDANGDGRGDRAELIELSTGSIQEHGPHAVFFGPDGYLYWTHGNFSYIYGEPSPLSPVRGWKNASMLGRDDAIGFGAQYTGGPGGNFLRKDLARHAAPLPAARGGGPGGGGPARAARADAPWELVALGFRNQYDGAFNLHGELFTYDSDMEWHRDSPWFRPTRTIHTVPGGDYGYREGSHVHPEYYFDDLPSTEHQGRGSPTGVAIYQAYAYPREYRDMLLQADWSRGRIIGSRLTRDGASYRSESSNFVYGEPLNVTDVEVGPDGNVYFSLGGRNTQGGIYRVVYTGQNAMGAPQAATPLDRVLTMAQPRSAFSRELARATREQMGMAQWQQALTAVARDAQAPPERRARALELLQVFGPGVDENTLVPLTRDPAWEVRAAAAYYLGMKSGPQARRTLVALLKDSDPFVQRRAAEALVRSGVHPVVDAPIDAVADVFPLLASPDRFVRYAGRTLLRQIHADQWKEQALTATGYPQATEAMMAYVQDLNSANVWAVGRLLRRELELLRANPSERELLDLVRLIQRTTLEDHGVRNFADEPSARGVAAVYPGMPSPQGGGFSISPRVQVYPEMGKILLERFPAADSMLNREIARLLVYLETPGALQEIAAQLNDPRSGREQQMWYAEVLSFLDRGWDDASAEHMTAFLERVNRENWRGGASFSRAVNRIRDSFLASQPAARAAVLARRIEAARPAPAVAAAPAPGGGGGFQMVVSDEEAFEELVYNPNVQQGTPAGGVVAYQKAMCAMCHTFGPIGSEFGPDLSTINQRFSRRDMVRAVTHPHETVSDLYAVEEITRTSGSKVTGMIAREDATSVVVQVSSGREVTIPKSQIRNRVRSERSAMPDGLMNLLSPQERRNLFLLLQAGPDAIPDTALVRLGITP